MGTSASPAALQAGEAWPAAVHARYALKFNGIGVGFIEFNTKTGAQTYVMGGHGEVSLLFGALKWAGSSSVSGAIEASTPKPKTYAFDWKKNSKGGAIALGYAGGTATSVSVQPPPNTGPDVIPLTDAHKSGPLDPLSAIMMLTRADGRPACERREAVFDGKHRYDIVFSPKRQVELAAVTPGGPPVNGVVWAQVVVANTVGGP